MNIYERIYTILTEGSLGASRTKRMASSKRVPTSVAGHQIGKKNAKRMLRGIKNTGNVEDKGQTLGSAFPDRFKRAVKSGSRRLPRPFKNT